MKIIVLAGVMFSLLGCQTLSASRTLPRVDFEYLTSGMTRGDLESELGGNAVEYEFGDLTLVNYSFLSSTAWKYRAALYFPIAPADFLIYWIEGPIQNRARKTATAVYDSEGRLMTLVVKQSDGNTLLEIGRKPNPEHPKLRSLVSIMTGYEVE